MSKQYDKKKAVAAKAAKANQSVNSTLRLLAVGCVAECYLLLAYNFFAHGSVNAIMVFYSVLSVLRYAGLALAAAGVVLAVLWKGQSKKRTFAVWGAAAGLFLSLTAFLMLAFYPAGTELLCVAVPLLMLYGVLFLLYPRDFSLCAAALALAFADLWLMRRSYLGHPNALRLLTALVIVLVVAAAVMTAVVRKNGGFLPCKKASCRIFFPNSNYVLMFGSCGLSVLAMVLGLVDLALAYYGMWVLGAAMFALAVYYTVKQV